jgi:cytoskeletal protein RodZ
MSGTRSKKQRDTIQKHDRILYKQSMSLFAMKKGVFCKVLVSLLFLFLVFVSIVAASNNTNTNVSNTTLASKNTTPAPLVPPSSTKQTPTLSTQADSSAVDKAYTCLQGLVANKSSFSLEEAAFGMLALGSNDKLVRTIQSTKHEREACWPKTGCTIRDTALVALAYQRSGMQTSEIESWLQSKRITPRELFWFLEIDTAQHTSASCSIKYDGRSYTTNIQEDMKFSEDAGSCLQLSPSGYWLAVSPSCIGKAFEVSCDKDFVTALIYQKNGGETVYVSSETHAAASLGTTVESVNVSCLSTGGGCDYQGTLWATYALQKLNKNTAPMLPYLVALADDTTKYFPSAFLYLLTRDPDKEYYAQLLQQRKQNQFWEFVGNGYTRFYDSSIGVLALLSSSGGASDAARTQAYLLNVQTKEGCWNNNNFRDTAFVLYAGWPRAGVITPGGGTPARFPQCSEGSFSCERLSECLEAGGIKQNSYECQGGSICCSVKVQRPSCASQQGVVCKANEQCDGSVSASSDGQCCIGSCSAVVKENACEAAGGSCASSCGSDERELSESCAATNAICCAPKEKVGSSWLWIILLLVLIVLVVIAILKRDALRFWLFKRTGKASSSPISRPAVPPAGASMYPRPPLRPSPPGFARPPLRPSARPTPSSRDKNSELEETMRKLKEMSG